MKGLFVLLMVVSLMWACGEAKTPPAEEPAVVEEIIVPDTIKTLIDTTKSKVDTSAKNKPSNRQ